MFCRNRGSENLDDVRICESCGNDVSSVTDFPIDTSQWLQGVPTSRTALAALALGLLAVFPPAGLAAVILGHVSLVGIRRNEGQRRGTDVAKLALICGYAGLLLFSLGFFGMARYLNIPVGSLLFERIATPAVASATTLPERSPRGSGPTVQEIQGMGALLQLSVAQTVHYHTNPTLGYVCTLNQLKASGFSDENLTSAAENGYILSIKDCVISPGGKVTSYLALASPRNGAQVRSFCTDHTGIIRLSRGDDLDNCAATGAPIK